MQYLTRGFPKSWLNCFIHIPSSQSEARNGVGKHLTTPYQWTPCTWSSVRKTCSHPGSLDGQEEDVSRPHTVGIATQSSTIVLQWRGWKSTLSPSFITFSEREPFLRGFLWWTFWTFWSQRCIWVSKRWGKRNFSKGSQFDHFPLLWRKPTLSILFLQPNSFHILPLDGGP